MQSLLYASQLKNSHFSASDHMKSALSVLDELNLPDTADTKVNYLSGGEKKRLAVGLELIAFEMPNFICLDELVSGLDSHSAATVSMAVIVQSDSMQLSSLFSSPGHLHPSQTHRRSPSDDNHRNSSALHADALQL